jgi:hypothetical protein
MGLLGNRYVVKISKAKVPVDRYLQVPCKERARRQRELETKERGGWGKKGGVRGREVNK